MKKQTLLLLFCGLLAINGKASNLGIIATKENAKSLLFAGGGGRIERPFVVKTNVFSLLFRNINLAGEFAFNKNMSGQLGIRFMIPYEPGFLNSTSSSTSGDLSVSLGGFAITPEFRFYPGKKENNTAPHGFYLGLYGRYSMFNTSIGTTLSNPLTLSGGGFTGGIPSSVTLPAQLNLNINLESSLTQIGGGFMLGKQWAENGFVVDWCFLGMGISQSSFEATAQNPVLTIQSSADELKKKIDINTQGLFSYDVSINTATGTATAKMSGMVPQIRSLLFGSLSFGYRF
ncbi:MAG: DUF3575 domain-containing protein [Bacteroidota bacterium]